MNYEIIADSASVIIALVALALSLCQFVTERRRSRKEATIHAFDALEGDESVTYLLSLNKDKIDDLINQKNSKDMRNQFQTDWNKLERALPLLEHFAVGVNAEIYDKATLNRMAGNQIITTYYACENLISLKRNGVGKEKNYSEFEKMANNLIQLRKKHRQSVPDKPASRP